MGRLVGEHGTSPEVVVAAMRAAGAGTLAGAPEPLLRVVCDYCGVEAAAPIYALVLPGAADRSPDAVMAPTATRLWRYTYETTHTAYGETAFLHARAGWTEMAPMPSARYNCATLVLRGRVASDGGGGGVGDVLVMGGHRRTAASAFSPPADTVERYMAARNQWIACAPMPAPRERFAAVEYAGRVHAIGGREYPDGAAPSYGDTHTRYDPVCDTWERLAPMPQGTHRAHAYRLRAAGGGAYIHVALRGDEGVVDYTTYESVTDTWQPIRRAALRV